jgi:3-oxoacyl-(acyl-carrier-protein) synthase
LKNTAPNKNHFLSRIFVTGMGVMSAIGDTVVANRTSLMHGTCGISTLQLFPSRFSGIMPFGEIKTSTADLQAIWQANEPGVTRTMVLAYAAFEEALADSGLTVAQIQSPRTALIGASTVGGMCLTDELYHDSNKAENGSEYLSSYDCASVTLYLQTRRKMWVLSIPSILPAPLLPMPFY